VPKIKLLQNPGEAGIILDEILRHPYILSSLSGKNESCLHISS